MTGSGRFATIVSTKFIATQRLLLAQKRTVGKGGFLIVRMCRTISFLRP